MKVLMITDNKINGVGGGSLGGKKYYSSILNAKGKYGFDFAVISPDEKLEYKQKVFVLSKSTKMDITSRLMGHSTFLYLHRKNIYAFIDQYEPDVIFLGRTRLGFIAKYAKKNNKNVKVITCFDNVEFDYVDGYFANSKGVKGLAFKKLEKKCVKVDEIDSVKYSDILIFLSKRDIDRAKVLYEKYGVNSKKEIICPVCLENKVELVKDNGKKNVMFIGSLGYASNSNAVTNFINDIWEKEFKNNKDISFVVAGSKPNGELIDLISKYDNCVLHNGFSTLEDVVNKNTLIIAPIEKGAGMKTKVAEALSMGLPVVGSTEAFVGYDAPLSKDKYDSLLVCDIAEETIKGINNFLSMDSDKMKLIKKQNQALFDEYYSFNSSFKIFEEMFKDIFQ